MTNMRTNFFIAVEKSLKVITSCDNMIHLKQAETYVDLVKNRFSDLFIGNNKTILKQFSLLKSYLKIQRTLIKNK
jgi:hypothetical protein